MIFNVELDLPEDRVAEYLRQRGWTLIPPKRPLPLPPPAPKPVLAPIDELCISVRLANALTNNAGFRCLSEVVTEAPNEILRIPNIGHVSLNELKRVLADLGLRLEMNLTDASDRNAFDRAVATMERSRNEFAAELKAKYSGIKIS